jgi:hypothetical protein
MNRLAQIIATMPLEDLKLLKRDLEEGNLHRLIEARMDRLTSGRDSRVCPVCGASLQPGEQRFVLEFGPSDLRQRASFDEQDCLTYFLENTIRSKHR